jgi:hypothetical protein
VNWAKQNLCEDNISVIVVFLTPPSEIAAKSFFDPRPPQCPASMEPSYQEQNPYDLDFGFGKQQQQPIPDIQQTNRGDAGLAAACATNALLEPINGRHWPKPPRYNDDDEDEVGQVEEDYAEKKEDDEDDDDEEDDEDDDEEEDEEDVDLGPETNVDTVDDIPNEFGKLDQAMGHDYPAEFLVKMPAKRENDHFPLDDIRPNSEFPLLFFLYYYYLRRFLQCRG